MSALRYTIPTPAEVNRASLDIFYVSPCKLQVESTLGQLKHLKSIFTISPTGSGKTLCFWLPPLFNGTGITVIITALNQLGEQMAEDVTRFGLPAISISAQTDTPANIQVRFQITNLCPHCLIIQAIRARKYRIVFVSPEQAIDSAGFGALWNAPSFTAHLFNVTFDEGHCISEWGRSFRPAYKNMHALKWLLPPNIRFHVASATLTTYQIRDIKSILQIQSHDTDIIRRANERPNIHLMVEEMKYSMKSLGDIDRILRLDAWSTGGTDDRISDCISPPKFMIFCNKRTEAERISRHFRKRLRSTDRNRVPWFHSGMSPIFRKTVTADLRSGRIWGIVCTDAAGMVRFVSQYYINNLPSHFIGF